MASLASNNISHAWVEERLSAYIDNQLDSLERVQLERHMRDCANCRTSLDSLQWTVSLLKQAPAPALPRSFTLPVPKETKRTSASIFNLGFAARWATVAVTVLLFAVIGVDAITQFGGGAMMPSPAIAPVAESQSGRIDVAFAQPTATNSMQDSSVAAPASLSAASSIAPTRAPEPTKAPASVGAAPAALPPVPAATQRAPASSAPAASPASQRAESPSAPVGLGGGPETLTANNNAPSITTTTAAKALAVGTATPFPTIVPSATATLVPTATVAPSPTEAQVAQAKSDPTRAPNPTNRAMPNTEMISPLRIAEIALFFLAIFFGTLMILLKRQMNYSVLRD